MINHPAVKSITPLEDPRSPIQKMRRREVSRRMFAHGLDHSPALPKDVLVGLAVANGVDLLAEPVVEEETEQLPPKRMRIMTLRKKLMDEKGIAWEHTKGLKRPELLAILNG